MKNFWLIFFFTFGISTQALANKAEEKKCAGLYKQQQLNRAARCFQQLAQALPSSKKYYRGRLLRNAASLWQAAAQKAPEAKATLYQKRAYLLLDIYTSQQLCLDAERCKKADETKQKICQKIGCSEIDIKASPAQAQIQISSKKWKKSGVGRIQQTIPPGSYSIIVTSAGRETWKKRIRLRPHTTKKLNIALKAPLSRKPPPRRIERRPPPRRGDPPKPKAGLPILAWVGYIGGAVLVVGGGAMAGIGYKQRADFKNDVWDIPGATAPSEAKRNDILGSSKTLFIAGSGIAAAGLGLIVVGIIIHVRSGRNNPPAQTTTQLPSQGTTHTHSKAEWKMHF